MLHNFCAQSGLPKFMTGTGDARQQGRRDMDCASGSGRIPTHQRIPAASSEIPALQTRTFRLIALRDTGRTGAPALPAAPAEPAQGGLSYRPDIDGLRGVAVAAVIAHHFSASLLPGGFLGVDVFFVISGYVITLSLLGRTHASLWNLATGFFARRIKRLVPALIVFVVATSVLMTLFDPAPRASLRTGLAALVALSNLHLLQQATDYFGGAAELNAFTHTWSLGVEDQFYLLFPLAIWIAGLGMGLHARARLFKFVTACALASFALFVWLTVTKPPLAFYLMPARLWEIGAGALICLAQHRARRRGESGPAFPRLRGAMQQAVRYCPVLIPIALVFVLGGAGSTLIATPLVVAFSALLIAVNRPGSADLRILTFAPVLFLGRISYSLYLYHWGVLTLSRWTIGVHWWTAPAQIALMIGLAWLSYRYLEVPLRHRRWANTPWKEIATGLIAVALACACLYAIEARMAGRFYLGERAELELRGGEPLTAAYRVPATGLNWAGAPCVIGGNADIGRTIDINACTLGNFDHAPRRILVIGDSFAASLLPAFDDVAGRDVAVTLTASWGASPVPEVPNAGTFAAMNAYYWNSVVPSHVARLRGGDTVFIVADLEPMSPARATREGAYARAQFERGLERLSQELHRRGIGLAVLHGLPFARDAACRPTSAMPQWFSPFGTPCRFLSREATLARRGELDAVLARLRDRGLIRIVDLMDVFCPGARCTYRAGETLLYRDEHSHPSVAGARLAAPAIAKALAP